jgi:hypothetical protein
MSIITELNKSKTVVGSVSQGNQVQTMLSKAATIQGSFTGANQVSATKLGVVSVHKLSQLTDVDLTGLIDGSLIEYDLESNTFKAVSSLNGGSF